MKAVKLGFYDGVAPPSVSTRRKARGQNIERLKNYVAKIVRVSKREKLREGISQQAVFGLPVEEQQVKWRAISGADQKSNFFKAKSDANLALPRRKLNIKS
jgi:hypothetical protein